MKKLFILLATCVYAISCSPLIEPHPREVWKYRFTQNSTVKVHVISNKCNLITFRYLNTNEVKQISIQDFTYQYVKISNGSRCPLIGGKNWLAHHDH